MNKSVRAAIVLVTISIAVAAVVASQNPKSAAVSEADLISQPTHWVPISYTLERSTNGKVTQIISAARYGDGSRSRMSSRISNGQKEGWISNVALGRFFELQHDHWVSHPMREQKNEGRPFMKLKRSSVTAVDPRDPRVEAVAAAVPSASFYLMEMSEGRLSTIFCPEINMLEVWSRIVAQQEQETSVVEHRVTSVILGEPSTERIPPPGATIELSNIPAGPGRAVRTFGEQ